MKRSHLQIQHLHGRYFCSGHHGSLADIAAGLQRDGHDPTAAVEIIDVPTNQIMLHAHEPLSALRIPRPIAEAIEHYRGGRHGR
jgi:hypothetical protein